jgi:Tfp pilus assembly protein PilF
MRIRALVVAALVALAPAAYAEARSGASAPRESRESEDARSEAKEQVEFGIKVAQNGLWKEAAYRWEKAVEIDPTYAAAWNNLAVAYEQQGNFDKAREAYEKAVTLDPKNLLFRQNYDLFKEINDRTRRRRDR